MADKIKTYFETIPTWRRNKLIESASLIHASETFRFLFSVGQFKNAQQTRHIHGSRIIKLFIEHGGTYELCLSEHMYERFHVMPLSFTKNHFDVLEDYICMEIFMSPQLTNLLMMNATCEGEKSL